MTLRIQKLQRLKQQKRLIRCLKELTKKLISSQVQPHWKPSAHVVLPDKGREVDARVDFLIDFTNHCLAICQKPRFGNEPMRSCKNNSQFKQVLSRQELVVNSPKFVLRHRPVNTGSVSGSCLAKVLSCLHEWHRGPGPPWMCQQKIANHPKTFQKTL